MAVDGAGKLFAVVFMLWTTQPPSAFFGTVGTEADVLSPLTQSELVSKGGGRQRLKPCGEGAARASSMEELCRAPPWRLLVQPSALQSSSMVVARTALRDTPAELCAKTIQFSSAGYRGGLHEQPPWRSSAELRAERATSMEELCRAPPWRLLVQPLLALRL
ncbi:hypothetical protein Bbelb_002180 [Branchiostoma belcheri]|nr:hypothetical protein Bbelb_002180 [Branchiostoma belcheri]